VVPENILIKIAVSFIFGPQVFNAQRLLVSGSPGDGVVVLMTKERTVSFLVEFYKPTPKGGQRTREHHPYEE
jgi:hypothetical protein